MIKLIFILFGVLALSLSMLILPSQVNAEAFKHATDPRLQKILDNMTLNQDIQLARIGGCDAALGINILGDPSILLTLLTVADKPGGLISDC